MNGQTLENPITSPDNDLLGIAGYAENLANFIRAVPAPFTIGIYGEWGSGKSSYVELLHYYLDQQTRQGKPPVKFITFGAWDYTTADELWRALLLRIALKLYDKPDDYFRSAAGDQRPAGEPAPGPENPPQGGKTARPLSALERFLQGRPFSPPKPAVKGQFEEAVSRIDGRLYTNISRDPQKELQLSQDAALRAMMVNLLDAAGTVSPAVALINRLINGKAGQPGERPEQDGRPGAAEFIRSPEEFYRFLNQYFMPKMEGLVVIFVDDLDRCLPNVALDLLEAIKVFLGELPCVFIIAADRQLIGQGLRLRYRDLFSAGDLTKTEALLDRKGREYFEKIIQIGIPVPARTPQQSHIFLSAQFPQWACATDLVLGAIGSNPRRLKQYCQGLSFNYSVYGEHRRSAPVLPAGCDLLEKCIALNAWNKDCLPALRGILEQGEPAFRDRLRKLEEWLDKIPKDSPQQDLLKALEQVDDPESLPLYRAAAAYGPIHRLFCTTPRFSQAGLSQLEAYLQLAGLAPDNREKLKSEDGFFTRLLKPAFQNQEPQAEEFLRADLARLFILQHTSPQILDRLVDLAGSAGFNREMKKLEDVLDDRPGPEALAGEFKALSDALNEPANQTARLFFQESTGAARFSEMLPQEILLLQGTQPAPRRDPAAAPGAPPTKDELDAFIHSLPEDALQRVRAALDLRVSLARYVVELRKFAKLRGLEARSARLHELLLTRREDVIALEEAVLGDIPDPPPLPADLSGYLEDRELKDFFRLLPRLRFIDVGELDEYAATLRAAPAIQEGSAAQRPVPEAGPVAAEQPAAPVGLVKEQPTPAPTTPGPSPELPPIQTAAPTRPAFDIFRLAVRQKSGPPGVYALSAVSPAGEATGECTLDWDRLYRKFQYTQQAILAETDQNITFKDFRWLQLSQEGIHEVGALIYNTFFPGELNARLREALSDPSRLLRLVLDLDDSDPRLEELPWETLYVPDLQSYFALSRGRSLMRLARPRLERQAPYLEALEVTPPLRVLAALSSPKDLPEWNISGEQSTLERSLKKNTVRFRILEHATPETLEKEIRSFRPQLLHLAAYGEYDEDRQAGSLVLEDENGQSARLGAERMAAMLADSELRLVVLNGAEVRATPGGRQYTHSLARSLTGAGVPYVIGAMRPILDQGTQLFSAELYRFFTSGASLDTALSEARKAMTMGSYDWSAYAFYTLAEDIDSFRLAISP